MHQISLLPPPEKDIFVPAVWGAGVFTLSLYYIVFIIIIIFISVRFSGNEMFRKPVMRCSVFRYCDVQFSGHRNIGIPDFRYCPAGAGCIGKTITYLDRLPPGLVLRLPTGPGHKGILLMPLPGRDGAFCPGIKLSAGPAFLKQS